MEFFDLEMNQVKEECEELALSQAGIEPKRRGLRRKIVCDGGCCGFSVKDDLR